MRKSPDVSERRYEIDIWIEHRNERALAIDLRTLGFRPFRPARTGDHRFFVEHRPGGWGKVDVKLHDPPPRRVSADLWWLVRHRRGLAVAVLGADGAGKSTLIRGLEDSLPFSTRSVYLGWRRRGGSAGTPAAESAGRHPLLRRLMGLVAWWLRTAVSLWRIEVRSRRGEVVLCDRHPIEAGATPSPEPSWVRRGKQVGSRLLPAPDLVVLLDAPPQLLLARKGEHDVELLGRMQQALQQVAESRGGVIVDATQDPETVLSSVEQSIWDRLAGRRE